MASSGGGINGDKAVPAMGLRQRVRGRVLEYFGLSDTTGIDAQSRVYVRHAWARIITETHIPDRRGGGYTFAGPWLKDDSTEPSGGYGGVAAGGVIIAAGSHSSGEWRTHVAIWRDGKFYPLALTAVNARDWAAQITPAVDTALAIIKEGKQIPAELIAYVADNGPSVVAPDNAAATSTTDAETVDTAATTEAPESKPMRRKSTSVRATGESKVFDSTMALICTIRALQQDHIENAQIGRVLVAAGLERCLVDLGWIVLPSKSDENF